MATQLFAHINKAIALLFFLLWGGSGIYAQVNVRPPKPPAPPQRQHRKKNKRETEALARQYYFRQEYEKALPLYRKLQKKYPRNEFFLFQYVNCLDELNQREEAIKRLKKIVKKRKNPSAKAALYLGYLYGKEGDGKSQKKYFEQAKKIAVQNPNTVSFIASEFSIRNFPQEAVDLYRKAWKKTKDDSFLLKTGDLYRTYQSWPEMTTAYLEYLDRHPDDLQMIKNRLQSALEKDREDVVFKQLKKSLLRRVQDRPKKTWFSDLLLWLSIQKKDFQMAFLQAKALDKRLHETGKRLLDLFDICVDNRDFAMAVQCADYVLKKGKSNPLYRSALASKLSAEYEKIVKLRDYSQNDLLDLEKELAAAIQDFGDDENIVYLAPDLAHLRTFYLNKGEEGIALLKKVIAYPGLNKYQRAKLKLELADDYLYMGEVWEATLLYSQIEKAIPQSWLASEAKFRNAKLSFYIGEFEWAKSQLLVLKASTSKPIANDALYLSLLIAGNLDADSSTHALRQYARASYMVFRNKPDKALQTLDSILKGNMFHPIFDDVYLLKAKIYEQKGDYEAEKENLQKLIDNFPSGVTADDALWMLAKRYEEEGNIEKAQAAYFEILKKHPDSIYAEEAREKYRKLRGE